MRLRTKVLRLFIRKFVVVLYFDEILVVSADPSSHIKHLRKIFEVLEPESLNIDLKKSTFFAESDLLPLFCFPTSDLNQSRRSQLS